MAGRMNRRALIRYGALGGAAAVAAGPLAAAGAPAPAPAAPPPFELDEATVADLQKRMGSGADTARSIAGKYVARIEALNRKGPELRAVLEINPDALAIADGLDAERRAGKVRGPLHGIPVLIKDNIDTADRMTTTAGSLALLGAIPRLRRRRRQAPARGGRGDPRQDQPLRVGQLPLHALLERLERARRPVPQPVRARPQPVAARARAPGPRPRPASARSRSAPRPTARSCRPRTTAASSASSRRSASFAAPASSRSPTARTRRAR